MAVELEPSYPAFPKRQEKTQGGFHSQLLDLSFAASWYVDSTMTGWRRCSQNEVEIFPKQCPTCHLALF